MTKAASETSPLLETNHTAAQGKKGVIFTTAHIQAGFYFCTPLPY